MRFIRLLIGLMTTWLIAPPVATGQNAIVHRTYTGPRLSEDRIASIGVGGQLRAIALDGKPLPQTKYSTKGTPELGFGDLIIEVPAGQHVIEAEFRTAQRRSEQPQTLAFEVQAGHEYVLRFETDPGARHWRLAVYESSRYRRPVPCPAPVDSAQPHRAAVRCAERFVAAQGYTTAPAAVDLYTIAYEFIEVAPTWEGVLALRRNTLAPEAVAVCTSDPKWYDVVFSSREPTASHGRVVRVQRGFAHTVMSIQHFDLVALGDSLRQCERGS